MKSFSQAWVTYLTISELILENKLLNTVINLIFVPIYYR